MNHNLRANLGCNILEISGGDVTLDIKLVIVADRFDHPRQASLTTILNLSAGNRRKAGEILVDGKLFALYVTAGESITVSPPSAL